MLQWKSGGLGELLCRKESSQLLGQLTCVMGEKNDYKFTTFGCKRAEI